MEQVKRDLLDSIDIFEKGINSSIGSISEHIEDAQSLPSSKDQLDDNELADIVRFCEEMHKKEHDRK